MKESESPAPPVVASSAAVAEEKKEVAPDAASAAAEKKEESSEQKADEEKPAPSAVAAEKKEVAPIAPVVSEPVKEKEEKEKQAAEADVLPAAKKAALLPLDDAGGEARRLRGVVVSDRADKTVRVRVERRIIHPLYRKTILRRRHFQAHDANNACAVGDTVVIEETRRVSKTKAWRVVARAGERG
jgi:small subunit ribosomal protein S17